MFIEDEEYLKIMQKYNKKRKRLWVAYLLFGFGFPFGLHRFYLGHYYAGTVLTALTLFSLGFLGFIGIMDLKYIKKRVDDYNHELSYALMRDYSKKYLKGAY